MIDIRFAQLRNLKLEIRVILFININADYKITKL